MNSPRNRKGESVNPPPNANASEFHPNQNPSMSEIEACLRHSRLINPSLHYRKFGAHQYTRNLVHSTENPLH